MAFKHLLLFIEQLQHLVLSLEANGGDIDQLQEVG